VLAILEGLQISLFDGYFVYCNRNDRCGRKSQHIYYLFNTAYTTEWTYSFSIL